MTQFQGLLLFDVGEPDIGNWREELGWRGMRDQWRLHTTDGKQTSQFIAIDDDEDSGELEIWAGDDETGVWDVIAFAKTYKAAKLVLLDEMRVSPNGIFKTITIGKYSSVCCKRCLEGSE